MIVFWDFLFYLLLLSEIVSPFDVTDEKNWLISVDISNQNFIDEYKRTRIFHGTNVVWKRPFIDNSMFIFDDKKLKELNKLGLNIIRLGIIWYGLMPQNRSIDWVYLNRLKEIVDNGKKYGLYFLLDLHQDLMSEAFCGDGAPIWLFLNETYYYTFPFPVKLTPYSRHKNGTISKEQCMKSSWPNYYFSEAVAKSFEDMYTNRAPLYLRDLLVETWSAIVLTFYNCSNVIGYDLFNEPFAGNLFRNPFIMIPDIANKRIYKLYEHLHETIRKIDKKKIIFIAGVTWTFGSTGFNIPGGVEYSNRTVLSFHYYKPPNTSPSISISQAINEAKSLKFGLILSEFFTSGEADKISEESFKTMDLADENKVSWIGWQYFFDDYDSFYDSRFDMTYKNSSRIYPITVSGQLNSFKFDSVKNIFTIQFSMDNNVLSNVTEIFCPHETHVSKPKISINSKCNVNYKFTKGNRLEVYHDKCLNGDLIDVKIFDFLID